MKIFILLFTILLSPAAFANSWCEGKHTYREKDQCYSNMVNSSKRALERKIKEVVNHPSMTSEKLAQLDIEHTQWAYNVQAQCQDNACVALSIEGRTKVLDLYLKQLSATVPAAQPVSMTEGSPSFNCSKASTTVERLICSSPQLAEQDNTLVGYYKDALGITDDNGWLKEEQIDWIKNVRNRCQDEACLTKAYEQRIDELFWTIKHLENGQ